MAVDREQLKNDLCRFYDFSDKIVLYVGAGGGQLLYPSIRTKKCILIDQNGALLEKLRIDLAACSAEEAFEIVGSGFDKVTFGGDVVYFEFCLHEMKDPGHMLAHARSLAPETVVFEHAVDSDWSYYAGEDGEVRRATEALQGFAIRRRQMISVEQRFRDYNELFAKLRSHGEVAIERSRELVGAREIVIPMKCQLLQL